jgi:hypothetical protein
VTDIKAGNFTITSGDEDRQRLAMILWGQAGCGKTTLAATARGNKLWVQFDDSGVSSVIGLNKQISTKYPLLDTALKNKIYVLDITKEELRYIAKFEQADPFSLGPILADESLNIETVVIDSLTSLGNDVLQYLIKFGGFKGAALATPGLQAYGARLAYIKAFITNFLRLTKKYNKDIIFISHEGSPDRDKDSGAVEQITLALGGNLPNESALQVGEVWYMSQSNKLGRQIYVSPYQYYKPMKTRLFKQQVGVPNFAWGYDIEKPDPQLELASWVDRWTMSGYEKQDYPKGSK